MGSSDAPPSREEVHAKFLPNARSVLGCEQTEWLWATLVAIDSVPDGAAVNPGPAT
jgi:hypothetical protein